MPPILVVCICSQCSSQDNLWVHPETYQFHCVNCIKKSIAAIDQTDISDWELSVEVQLTYSALPSLKN